MANIGFCTPYLRCEATRVAARLADWASQRGHGVSIYPLTRNPRRIGLACDDSAQANHGQRFTDWAVKHDTIVWTYVPVKEQISWVNKQGITSVAYTLWHELLREDRDAFRIAQAVIAPSAAAAKFLGGRFGVKCPQFVPWDSGLPLTTKDPRQKTDQLRLLLPLFDREPYKTELTIIDILGRVLRAYPHVTGTVAFNTSTLAGYALRRLQQLKKSFGVRLELWRGVTWDSYPQLYGDHDLTLWPAHHENTGMVGLDSLSMGTPVLAFHYQPLTEFITQRVNAYLVPSHNSLNQLGVPQLDPDYQLFEQCIRQLVEDRSLLKKMQRTVLKGLAYRREVADDNLTRLFG